MHAYYLSPLLEILPISTNTTFMKTHIHVHVPKTSSMYSVLHVQHTLNKHISGHSVAIYALFTSEAKWHVQCSNQGMPSTWIFMNLDPILLLCLHSWVVVKHWYWSYVRLLGPFLSQFTNPLSNQMLTCNIRAFLGLQMCLTITDRVTSMTLPKVLDGERLITSWRIWGTPHCPMVQSDHSSYMTSYIPSQRYTNSSIRYSIAPSLLKHRLLSSVAKLTFNLVPSCYNCSRGSPHQTMAKVCLYVILNYRFSDTSESDSGNACFWITTALAI